LVILQSSCAKNNTVLPKVAVVGHAGISLHRDRAIFPANSFESIKYAIDILDADGVEVDVQMTKDSVLVLYHDKFLEFSTNLNGCVSQFSFNEIKSAKLDNTKHTIICLEDVLEYIDSRNKTVFLDVKGYDYCNENNISMSAFNHGFLNSISDVSIAFVATIVISNTSSSFLNQVNHTNKCIEISSANNGIDKLNTFGFQSALINLANVSEDDKEILKNVNWGVLGVKDEWSVDAGIKLLPKFVITDNIAYTKKVTE